MVKKKKIGVERMSKGIREKRMNRMECVRVYGLQIQKFT